MQKGVRYIIIAEKMALPILSCKNAFWYERQSSVTLLLAVF